jgi:hypothetical protein
MPYRFLALNIKDFIPVFVCIFAVWRIRDVYPGSRIRLFSIPDPGSELSPFRIPDPGSSSKNLSILTLKKAKKMVYKL